METYKFILYTHSHCKYCKLAKTMLQNFIDEGMIQSHDVIEDGYPNFNPSTPSLYKFDSNGKEISKLDGVHTQSVYIRFLQ